MVDLLPFRPEVTSARQREPVVLDLSSEHADRVFKSLSSETARRVLQTLYDEPHVASDIAEELDTSLQNVDYHLRNLREAELVDVVDTWYSKTGNEMKVYAPTAEALMVLSDADDASRLRSVASTLVASLLFIGLATVLFRFVVVERFLPGDDHRADAPDDPGVGIEETAPLADPLGALPAALDPGIVFLVGAILGLAATVLVLLARSRWSRAEA